MCQSKEFLQPDKNFQKSIIKNLDLNQPDKITDYIPTKTSVQILNIYLQELLKEESMKSTMLIETYREEKTHILQILLTILSKKHQLMTTLEVENMMRDIVTKLGSVDLEAAEAAAYLIVYKKFHLPVFVSGVQKDFSKAILESLREALVREGLEREVHSLLTTGEELKTMTEMELLTVLRSVNEKICKKYKYEGIILVFDNFNEFLNDCSEEAFILVIEKLKIICEFANTSQKEKLSVIVVSDMSMKEYENKLSKEVLNSYLDVERKIREII